MLWTNSVVWAAETVSNNTEFLQYQQPTVSGGSMLSNILYIFSLLFSFAIVLVLAYFTSRFLGRRSLAGMSSSTGRVLSSFALGQNKNLVVVELANRYLVLGVTEHNVNFLCELQDEDAIAGLLEEKSNDFMSPVGQAFEKQMKTLQGFSSKFSNIIGRK